MRYKTKEKVKTDILKDIEELKKYSDIDHYIQANFRQFLTHGEYDDNSIELSYHYKMLKSIEEDKEFLSKLYFVMTKYIEQCNSKELHIADVSNCLAKSNYIEKSHEILNKYSKSLSSVVKLAIVESWQDGFEKAIKYISENEF